MFDCRPRFDREQFPQDRPDGASGFSPLDEWYDVDDEEEHPNRP